MQPRWPMRVIALCAFVGMLGGGCAVALGTPPGRNSPASMVAHARGGGPTAGLDREATAVSEALHLRAIRAAELALSRSRDRDVRAMAESVIAADARAMAQQTAILRQLGIRNADDNAIAGQVDRESERDLRHLSAHDDRSFDQAYLATQRAIGERSRMLIDRELLPRASLEPVREMLRTDRAVSVARIEAARALARSR